jgi:hypothetical protein
MEIKSTNKMDAIEAAMNLWLHDETFYCNSCGTDFNWAEFAKEHCCDNPKIGRNKEHFRALVKQNKYIQQTRKNNLASIDDLSMRWGISLPPRLLFFLEGYFKRYGEKFLNNNKELRQFMKRFPYFRIPERV